MATQTQELIVVEQLPVITEKLKVVSDDVDMKIAEALALECTEKTVTTVKNLRAALRKEHEEWEDRRKQVKTSIMSPYEAFNDIYEQYVGGKYKSADAALKERVDTVEGEIKKKKENDLRAYFAEYATQGSVTDYVKYKDAGIKVGISESMKSLQGKVQDFVGRVRDDLDLIDTQENKEEILVEYKKNHNCSQAITAVTERHRAVAEQKARQAEAEKRKAAEQESVKKVDEAAPLAPPVCQAPETLPPTSVSPDCDPVKTLIFKVTAPISSLRVLKQFLDDGGFEYE